MPEHVTIEGKAGSRVVLTTCRWHVVKNTIKPGKKGQKVRLTKLDDK